jgi:hypothetical protein
MRLRKVKRPARLGGVVADGESVLRGGLSPEGVFGWPVNPDLLRIIVVLCGDCPPFGMCGCRGLGWGGRRCRPWPAALRGVPALRSSGAGNVMVFRSLGARSPRSLPAFPAHPASPLISLDLSPSPTIFLDCLASPPLSRLPRCIPPLSASLHVSRDLPPAPPPCPRSFPLPFPQSFPSPFPLRCPSSSCRHHLRESLPSPMTILILLTSPPSPGARAPGGLFPSPSHHASMADPPLREICPPAFRHDRVVGVCVAPL